ncbi:UDP-N-acetylmuramoyl-L-alanyl-D-glutamate--2,6-diaminopimelate ligase [Gilvimarinus polysaccharolyticus]|uniref:UDP-N-acetylmuramoyl-L-alanyl-D-glutamate--2, 6-diaminopimelate ligase n=1 Tax=Gilvimarinus polysaccharolyticus TaxID=863921 RepID=UPI000AE3FC48|nr:UDP-N-acetylmuramoyl-L-alanyl-D-glutamate--2,6-diaminopimelate ligase [Gilvimarinus polysaccharolyticus]
MIAVRATERAMTLAQLLDDASLDALDSVRWSALQADSRRVMPGHVFVALQGATADGRDYISDAINRGASAIVIDADGKAPEVQFLGAVPLISVTDLSANMSAIAARAYADPSAELNVIGVTGTNGKTTCSVLIAQLFEALGQRTAVVGTLGYGRVGKAMQATGFTTPDAIASQALLRDLAEQQIKTVAIEVSSHALVQDRVKAVRMSTAVFTNLSHDHLDYHGDLKAYGKAKARLLRARDLQCAIINRDDSWCKSLLGKARTKALTQVLSYSLASKEADIYFENLEYSSAGIVGTVITPAGKAELSSLLIGDFNASNILAAIAVAVSAGYSLDKIAAAIPTLQPAPGRMEQISVSAEQGVQVVVDYAHTPDALEKTLRALRRHTEGSLWCVFGCGGERDREKRPAMGRVAEKSADHTIVTNDNPRGEDPASIASEVVRGMHRPERCLVIAERDKAIDLAVQQARAGDTVLLAGKGHEAVQVFADRQLPFSDVQQARAALVKRLAKVAQEGRA